MKELPPTDLHFVVSRLPKDIRALMQEHPLIVAGGFIRETIAGGKVSDIDIFGATKEALELAGMCLALSRNGRKFSTNNAITVLSPPRFTVQFITRWLFETPQLCTESFDFTVCQAAVWYDKETSKFKSSISENFYPDLAARRLVYTYPVRQEEAGGSMLRMRKFIARGYTIQAGSMAGVIARLVGKLKEHENCNLSNEKWVAQILTGLLREVDPLTVIDGVDFVDDTAIQELKGAKMRKFELRNGIIVEEAKGHLYPWGSMFKSKDRYWDKYIVLSVPNGLEESDWEVGEQPVWTVSSRKAGFPSGGAHGSQYDIIKEVTE